MVNERSIKERKRNMTNILIADDYILKPFEPLEVIAKVRARMRWLKSGSIEEKERMIYLILEEYLQRNKYIAQDGMMIML